MNFKKTVKVRTFKTLEVRIFKTLKVRTFKTFKGRTFKTLKVRTLKTLKVRTFRILKVRTFSTSKVRTFKTLKIRTFNLALLKLEGNGKESDPTDTSVDTLANALVDSRSTVGQQTADCRPTGWPLFKLIRYEMHRWCVGGVLVTPLGLMELF